MDEILDTLNKLIRDEHGSRVAIDSMWVDAQVDSLGTTLIFLDLDEKYGCFNKEWFNSMTKESWEQLTICDIIERVTNAST